MATAFHFLISKRTPLPPAAVAATAGLPFWSDRINKKRRGRRRRHANEMKGQIDRSIERSSFYSIHPSIHPSSQPPPKTTYLGIGHDNIARNFGRHGAGYSSLFGLDLVAGVCRCCVVSVLDAWGGLGGNGRPERLIHPVDLCRLRCGSEALFWGTKPLYSCWGMT
jgi:hypothetical protein